MAERPDALAGAEQRVDAAEALLNHAWALMEAWQRCRAALEETRSGRMRGHEEEDRAEEGGSEGEVDQRCLAVINGIYKDSRGLALEAEPLLVKARDYYAAVVDRLCEYDRCRLEGGYAEAQLFDEDASAWSSEEDRRETCASPRLEALRGFPDDDTGNFIWTSSLSRRNSKELQSEYAFDPGVELAIWSCRRWDDREEDENGDDDTDGDILVSPGNQDGGGGGGGGGGAGGPS